jgi:hypothetical protein
MGGAGRRSQLLVVGSAGSDGRTGCTEVVGVGRDTMPVVVGLGEVSTGRCVVVGGVV